jgi:hypothetical protein
VAAAVTPAVAAIVVEAVRARRATVVTAADAATVAAPLRARTPDAVTAALAATVDAPYSGPALAAGTYSTSIPTNATDAVRDAVSGRST